MSDYADRIAFRQISIEIPADDLLSCIWYSDGSGARGLAGVGLEAGHSSFRLVSIQELGDRPDIVRITLVRASDDS